MFETSILVAGAGQAYDAASPSQHTAAAVKPSAVWDPSQQHTQAASKPTKTHKPSQHALAGKPYKPNGPSAAYNTHLASPQATEHHSQSKPKPKPSSAYTHAAQPHHPQPSSDGSASNVVVAPSSSKPSKSASWEDHTMAAALPEASGTSEHVAKRGIKLLEQVQKRIQEEPWENLDSQLLCPAGETACPM